MNAYALCTLHQVNASNNAGDRPIHWARNMGHGAVEEALKQARAGFHSDLLFFPPKITLQRIFALFL